MWEQTGRPEGAHSRMGGASLETILQRPYETLPFRYTVPMVLLLQLCETLGAIPVDQVDATVSYFHGAPDQGSGTPKWVVPYDRTIQPISAVESGFFGPAGEHHIPNGLCLQLS